MYLLSPLKWIWKLEGKKLACKQVSTCGFGSYIYMRKWSVAHGCLIASSRTLLPAEKFNRANMGRPLPTLILCLSLLAAFTFTVVSASRFRPFEDGLIVLPSEGLPKASESKDDEYRFGTRWAVLVAGSAGYGNYRHQADVCHAYQILKRGGLKDENIIVFMYDDIANDPSNPRPGVIINHPDGSDVYAGVPKDYTGRDVTVSNLFGVILGNKTAVTGGSGKVVDSSPNDHIFIFYSDHGGPGILGMPTYPYLFANDFIDVLKEKHAVGTYKEMLIYIEACESGSIFEGLLPNDLNIYVTTASNAEENSWGTYCPGMYPPSPPEFHTCLGDLYSVSWMEDSEAHNLKEETLNEQYEKVKIRTSNHNTYMSGSHVMQYGDVNVNSEEAYVYLGSDPAYDNVHSHSEKKLPMGLQGFLEGKKAMGVNQRDADLLYLWYKYQKANEGSGAKAEAQHELVKEMGNRMRLDGNIDMLGKLLFGSEKGPRVLKEVRPPGHPLVDNWDCLKAMVGTFESHCGRLGQYGMKHMRAFANICNAGIDVNRMAAECADACARNN